jgi:hypothetical protein
MVSTPDARVPPPSRPARRSGRGDPQQTPTTGLAPVGSDGGRRSYWAYQSEHASDPLPCISWEPHGFPLLPRNRPVAIMSAGFVHHPGQNDSQHVTPRETNWPVHS